MIGSGFSLSAMGFDGKATAPANGIDPRAGSCPFVAAHVPWGGAAKGSRGFVADRRLTNSAARDMASPQVAASGGRRARVRRCRRSCYAARRRRSIGKSRLPSRCSTSSLARSGTETGDRERPVNTSSGVRWPSPWWGRCALNHAA